MYGSTLCVGADIHLDEIVLRAVDKLTGHEVIERFRVANKWPGAQSAAATIAQVATTLGYTRIEIGFSFSDYQPKMKFAARPHLPSVWQAIGQACLAWNLAQAVHNGNLVACCVGCAARGVTTRGG